MIEIVKLWHHYGTRPVLQDVSLHVSKGERLVVMGPNGMGKSTLLSVVAGLLPAFRGYVEIDGLRRRRSIDEEKKVRRMVFYLPDVPWLPLHVSTREYVLAVGRLYCVGEDRLLERTERLLDLFDLGEVADTAMSSLSTGQRKKAGICSALVTEAPVMVLDEPFSGGLDSSALHALQQVLKAIAGIDKTTLIMAVPVPELVDGLADRVAVIKAGRIVACETPEMLKQQTGNPTLAGALESILRPESAQKIQRFIEGEKR